MKSYVLNKQFLIDIGACDSQIIIFEQLFPDGAEITYKNVRLAYERGLKLVWLMSEIGGGIVQKYWEESNNLYNSSIQFDENGVSFIDSIKYWNDRAHLVSTYTYNVLIDYMSKLTGEEIK